ncbi:MAG: electron transport complex subunit RsxC [Victivallaceae bacterium]
MSDRKDLPPRPLAFPGGIHPEYDGKDLSCDKPIQTAPLFDKYVILVNQNVGAPPKVVVKKGDAVKKGQLLAEPGGFVSVPLHAPTSGVISEIGVAPGPMGVMVPAIFLDSDGKDEWTEDRMPAMDWRTADPAELKKRVADAGIVGMGGAAFPTHVKLSPPPGKNIDCVILNGAECEPYLTADHRVMLETPEKVLAGAAIMARILNVKNIIIGVELNKTDALQALEKLAPEYGVKVVGLKVQYPQGSEKQLIFALTGRKVPTGGLPMDAGCVVQNVGTAAALCDAVADGVPLIERVTTVTGKPVRNPGNFRVLVGTPAVKLIELAGGVTEEPRKLIFGGPMMGFAQRSVDVPVSKNASGVLLLGKDDIVQYESTACIRCGRCLRGCPMHLSPGPLSMLIESGKFDLAANNHVMDCLECGACAYGCPAHRPLVQHMRRAKAEIRRLMKK